MDEAVHALARRLAATGTAHVVLHNISSLSSAEAARVRAMMESALSPARTGPPVEIALTISRNVHGYLLVAEYDRNGERVEEMEPFEPDAPALHARTAITPRLIWEQDTPMLDLQVTGDRMIILEPAAIVIYKRGAAGWERPDSYAFNPVPVVVRDPRGRLQLSGDSITAYLPGATCRAVTEVRCEPDSAMFSLGGKQVRFTPGQNTLEAADGAQLGFSIAPGLPASQRIESWGDDFIALDSGCAAGQILATGPGDRASPDSLTAFKLIDAQPVPMSDPAGLPGPMVALWPAGDGALAIIRNPLSARYAAYGIGIDCSH